MITSNYILIINLNLNTARDIKEFVNMLFFAKISLEDFILERRKDTSAFEKTPMDQRSLLKLRGFVRDVVMELDDRCTMTVEDLNKSDRANYSFSFTGDQAFSFQTLCEFILEVLADDAETRETDHPDYKYFQDVFDRIIEFLLSANPYGGSEASEKSLYAHEASIIDVDKIDFDAEFPSLQYDKEGFPDIIYDKDDNAK